MPLGQFDELIRYRQHLTLPSASERFLRQGAGDCQSRAQLPKGTVKLLYTQSVYEPGQCDKYDRR